MTQFITLVAFAIFGIMIAFNIFILCLGVWHWFSASPEVAQSDAALVLQVNACLLPVATVAFLWWWAVT